MSPQVSIALYSGLIVERDAVSASLRAKLAALRRANGQQINIEVVAFCQHSNVKDPAIQVVTGVADLLNREAFRRATLHIFEFAIYYELFNVALLLEPRRTAAVYHNVTPRELIADSTVRAAIDRSTIQKHLLARMSHIACDSEFNRQDLLDFGIPPERLSVLPLPGSVEARPSPLRGRRRSSEPIRFLFVGRLVRAKGVLDLLAAANRLLEDGEHGFELCVAGSIRGSDSSAIDAIDRALASATSRVLSFAPDLLPEDLATAYRRADFFVLPSYHEGYCIPIVEAFAAGCPVIAYDNTNIPAITNGLSELVPTGDVDGLAEAMKRAIEGLRASRSRGTEYLVWTAAGPLPEAQWHEAAYSYVQDLRRAHDEGFVGLVSQLLKSLQNGQELRSQYNTLRPLAAIRSQVVST